MKLFIAAAVFATTFFSGAEEDAAKKLKFEVGANWSTISVRPQTLLSDFSREGPYLIIQHLPDNRVLLSSFESSRRSQFTPEAIRYIDADELERILSAIIEIFTNAQQMERKVSGHPIYRPPVTTIEISIRKATGQKNFSRILSDGEVLTNLIATSLNPDGSNTAE